MKRTLLISLLVLMAGLSSLQAQQIPVNPKAGAVSLEEVAMTRYEPDTTAAALILYEENIVTMSFDPSFSLSKMVSFRTRIKILKEDGKEYADFKIPYSRDAADGEYVSNIRVTTYNLEDGAIRKTKLDKKYIFRENVTEQVSVCSFSAPEVRVGSVIEVSYELKSKRYWDVPVIDLQYEIPANRIDARMAYVNYLSFNKVMHGFLTPRFETEVQSRTFNIYGNSLSYNQVFDSYFAVDVPAMVTESHSFCPDQYLSTVEYELSSFIVPGYVNNSYSRTWADVDKAILESPIAKECHVRNPRLAEYKERISGLDNEVEQIAAVRSAVMETVKWNEKRGLVPQSVSKTLKSGTGSAASINAVVASALNGLGFEAEPVLIKLRSEGVLADFHVSRDAFDTFILRIKTPSGEIHYLDAARSDAYPDVLDPNYLVDRGRLVVPEGYVSGWLDLRKLVKNVEMMTVQAQVDAGGQVSGSVRLEGKNESAYDMKHRRHRAESEEAFIESLEEDTDIEISDFSFEGDSYSPAATYAFSFTQEATVSGDYIYIRPFIFSFHSEGDFRSPTRVIPIDFTYAGSILYSYVLQIPEGYAVEQLPPTVRFVASGIQAEVRCQYVQAAPNRIQLRYSFKNESMLAAAEAYADIRAFWEQLCGIYKNTIVLKKL